MTRDAASFTVIKHRAVAFDMDPLQERQLSSSAAGPSHAYDPAEAQSDIVNNLQYGGLSFISVSIAKLSDQLVAAAVKVHNAVLES